MSVSSFKSINDPIHLSVSTCSGDWAGLFYTIKDVASLVVVSDVPNGYLAIIIKQMKLGSPNCWLSVLLNWFSTIDFFLCREEKSATLMTNF